METGTSNSSTPIKRTRGSPIKINVNDGIRIPSTDTPKAPIRSDRPKLILAIRNTNSPQTPQTSMRMKDKLARRIVSPKMKTTNENIFQTNTKVETNPMTATSKDNKLSNIKSPLKPINNQVFSPSVAKTPIASSKKPLKVSTSKKSLLKRLVASATPAKSHSPRKLTSSNHSNNITLTSYQNPQECIDRLVHTLTGKGVECKQKEYGSVKTRHSPWSRLTFVVRKKSTKDKNPFGTF